MKTLLHICCAPCAIGTIRELRHSLSQPLDGFFYNPNIHPLTEFERRKESLQYYLENFEKIEVIYPEYDPREFFAQVDLNQGYPERCQGCWKMRLRKTAQFASENKYTSFTTTLLISPYQEIAKIEEIGKTLAEEFQLEFIVRPFRRLFPESRKEAKALGLYRQNYCGCLLSEWERFQKLRTQGLKSEL